MFARCIALLMTVLVAMHMVATSYAATTPDEAAISFDIVDAVADLPDDVPRPADDASAPASPHCSMPCHDHCKGMAVFSFATICVNKQPRYAGLTTAAQPMVVSILVPPPQ